MNIKIKFLLSLVFSLLVFWSYRNLNIGLLSACCLDEYSYHGSLLNIYEGLISFDLEKIFHFHFYSYGFGFFLTNLLAASPFFASDNIEMTIFLPRVVTSIFAVGSLWYIYKISRIYVDDLASNIIVLIVLSMPGFWRNAYWFHPDWMMTFFIILTIYYFAKDNWRFHKYFWRGCLTFGFALSVKIQAITFYPFIFLYIFYNNFYSKNFEGLYDKAVLFFKSILLSITIFIFTNPYLLHPKGLEVFLKAFFANMYSNATNHGLNEKIKIGEKISTSIDPFYLNTYIFLLIILLAIVITFSILNKRLKKSIFPIIAFCFIINIAYLFLIVNKNWQHYYLSMLVISPLLLIFIIQQMLKQYKYIFLAAVLLIQIMTHLSIYKQTYFSEKEKIKVLSKNKKISDLLVSDLKLVVNTHTNVLIDPYFPFDFRDLGLSYNNVHIIIGPLSMNMFDLNAFLNYNLGLKDSTYFVQKDFIVVSKKNIYFEKEKVKSMVNLEGYSKAVKIIENFNHNGDLGYRKYTENEYYYIWQKK